MSLPAVASAWLEFPVLWPTPSSSFSSRAAQAPLDGTRMEALIFGGPVDLYESLDKARKQTRL